MALRKIFFLFVLSALFACGSDSTAVAPDPTSTTPPTATTEPPTPIPTPTSQPATPKPQPTQAPATEVPATILPPPTPTFTPVPVTPEPEPIPESRIRQCIAPDQTAVLNHKAIVTNIAVQIVEESGNGSSDGDVHVNTPDGLNYDFQAVGEFVAVKDVSGELEIQVRQEPWGSSTTVSVNTAVAMDIGGDRVGVYLGQDPPLFVNGQQTDLNGRAMNLTNGGQIEQSGAEYTMIWPDQTRASVTLRGGFLTLIFSLCPGRSENVSGLFGNFDAIAENDLTARDGELVSLSAADGDSYYQQLYRVFGDSWRISPEESLFVYLPGETTDTFTDLDFPYLYDPAAEFSDDVRQNAETVCRDAGVTDPKFLDDCILDVGVTADETFAKSAAETQAGLEQIDVLPEELTCLNFIEGFAECNDLSPIPEDAMVGSDYEVTIETLIGSVIVAESFICGPILPFRTAGCSFQTVGLMFEGGGAIWIFELVSGGQAEFVAVTECSFPVGEGVAC